MTHHIAVVSVYVKNDCIKKFIEIALENARQSRNEAGVIDFRVVQSKTDETEFLFVETYRSVEDQLKHRETEHFISFKTQVQELLREPYAVKTYSGV